MGPGDVTSREAPADTTLPVLFDREDCDLFARYPKKVPWTPEYVSLADQGRFKDIRERLKKLADWLAGQTRIEVRVRPFTSLYQANGRSPSEIWCCVYPAAAPNKSYALQVAFIVSARGAELCICLGAGQAQIQSPDDQVKARQALQSLQARLASVPSDVVAALEQGLPDGAVYRSSWLQPPGTSEFSSLSEWLAYCATPQGPKASISVYLKVDELESLGSDVGNLFLQLADACAPLIAYCYQGREPHPDETGPDDGRAAHQPPAQASFDADSLAELAAASPHELELDQQVYRAVAAAIGSGKHVILTGPPGTAKTTLAELTGRLARLAGLCSGYTLTTATADWTTYDTIGGLRPAKSGDALEFRDGLFLEAIRKGRWLVIDEFNRSNFDRAFGQLFTVLSGQSVVLPYEDPVSGRRIVLSREGSAGQYDPGDYEHIYIPKSWRIVATMNVFDKSLLFEMSFALMRRFAFIEVPSPRREVFAELWGRQLAAMPSEQSELINRVLNGLYGLTSIKDIGPAIFIDMAAFAREYFTQGAPPSPKDLAFQLFFSYLLPQFEGITKPEGQKLFGKLLRLVGEGYRDQARSTLTEVLGITLSREQLPDEEDDADADLEADLGQGGAEPPDTE